MKKLIMLSIFALGTFTASASNDLFKNYYADKTDKGLGFEIKYQKRFVVRQVNGDGNGGIISETIIYDQTFCDTSTNLSYRGFIIHEQYIINNTSGMPRFYNVHDLGMCF